MDATDRAAGNRLAMGRFVAGRVGLVLSSERGKALGRAKQKQAARVRAMLEKLDAKGKVRDG